MNALDPTLLQLERADYSVMLDCLTALQVEISSACNLRCPQCFNRVPEHVTALMTWDLWQQKVRPHLPNVRWVYLVGIGEPLLNQHFFDFVRDARSFGAEVHTTSNLQLMSPEIADRLVAEGLEFLSFSCDGASTGVYESIRLRGRMDRFLNGLALVVEARRRHGTRKPRLVLNFGAGRNNIDELPDVVRLAHEHGVDTVVAYHNVAYLEETAQNSLFHDQDRSDSAFSEAAALCKTHSIEFVSPGLFAKPRRIRPGQIYCDAPFNHIYIHADGRVGPCCMDFPKRFILGNLNEATLTDVWNGEPIRELRRQMVTEPSETCRHCVAHLKMDLSNPRHFFRFPGAEAYIGGLPPRR